MFAAYMPGQQISATDATLFDECWPLTADSDELYDDDNALQV